MNEMTDLELLVAYLEMDSLINKARAIFHEDATNVTAQQVYQSTLSMQTDYLAEYIRRINLAKKGGTL